jgi:glycosyltransferase involved in cell wall biosynthesis
VVVNETLSYDDLLKLKSGCDCYVSLHKSEGWGFGMIEAMNLGVPVICTAYSGNMEFCTPETAWLVDYTLIPLAPDDYIFVREGQTWAEPDVADAARQMRAVKADAEGRRAKARAALAFVQQKFSAEAIAKRYQARLAEILTTLAPSAVKPPVKSPRAPRRATKD